MIDFRYHLVSIIAIFFALAAGIALGAGPLNDQADQLVANQVSELSRSNKELRDQVGALENELKFQDEFSGAVSPVILDGRMAGRSVAVVGLPGAAEALTDALREALQTAGATVTGVVSISPTWTDAPSAAALDALAASRVRSGTTLPEGDGYDRGAAVLASAVVVLDASEAGGDEEARNTLAAFAEAGLIEGSITRRADVVLSVTGSIFTDDEAERRLRALVSLVTALDRAGAGEVVAGAAASAADGGVIQAVRNDDEVAAAVSTVDSADSAPGVTSSVLALQEQVAGDAGQYGVIGKTDGPLPTSVLNRAS